jgi:type IV pilus assembly protein PilV
MTPIRAGGFSLVEVLVAVLVVTVGLLGLAALQITGLKVTESAQFRTLATLAAYDTIDRLRTDPSPLFNNGTRKGKIKKDDCPVTDTDNNAKTRWYRGFCAFKLPPPDQQDNLVTVDCSGTDCGTGNCLIEVFWDDSSAVNNVQRGSTLAGTSGDKSFRVCTRLLLPL